MSNLNIYKFEEWLRIKNLSENTIQQYLYYFMNYNKNTISQELCNKFLSEKINNNNVARSFLRNLKAFIIENYKELGFEKEEIIDINMIHIPNVTGRKKKKVIEIISIEDLNKIEEKLYTEKEKLMLLISFYGMLRVGELFKLRINSFYWDDWNKDQSKSIKVKIEGKGNKEEIVFIPSFIAKRLQNYIEQNSQKYKKFLEESNLFGINNYTLKSIKSKSSSWGRKLNNAGKITGISHRIYPHLLRHSFASFLINEKKIDIRKVQELLRHSSITSTQIYTHIDKKQLKEEIDSFINL